MSTVAEVYERETGRSYADYLVIKGFAGQTSPAAGQAPPPDQPGDFEELAGIIQQMTSEQRQRVRALLDQADGAADARRSRDAVDDGLVGRANRPVDARVERFSKTAAPGSFDAMVREMVRPRSFNDVVGEREPTTKIFAEVAKTDDDDEPASLTKSSRRRVPARRRPHITNV